MKNPPPAYLPGVWYDVDTLPPPDHTPAVSVLCDGLYSIIVKTYNPTTDEFEYKHIANATIRIEYVKQQRVFAWSPNPDKGRVVAFSLYGDPLELYEGRVTKKTLNAANDFTVSAEESKRHHIETPKREDYI